MSAYAILTRPFRRAYALIFHRHVTLQVAEGGVRVMLQERPTTPNRDRPPTRAELAARKVQQEFRLMQQQLTELLNELPETRSSMRHLVVVEKALERKGLPALQSLPLALLRRALDQLEGMVVNWSPTGLAALRSRIAVAIIDRDNPLTSAEAEAEAEAYRTATLLDSLSGDDLEGDPDVRTDGDALAAAYAALGDLAPVAVEFQGDLGSSSAKAVSRDQTQAAAAASVAIRLRELQR